MLGPCRAAHLITVACVEGERVSRAVGGVQAFSQSGTSYPLQIDVTFFKNVAHLKIASDSHDAVARICIAFGDAWNRIEIVMQEHWTASSAEAEAFMGESRRQEASTAKQVEAIFAPSE